MSAHTKGTWAAHEWSGGWIVYGGRLPLSAGIEVARVATGEENDRHEADARLIAAAPDMLKASKAAWFALQSLLAVREGITDEALRGVADALDAAIAKAVGK